ncbi:alkaline phosphatase, partial [Clostridium perfringens]
TWITDLTDEEAQYILDGDGSSYKREGGYNAVISKRLLVGWSGHGHSAVDVGVWAYGPIAEKLKGQVDNTEIAVAGAEVIGVDLAKATAELQARHIYPKFKINRDKEVLYPAKALTEALGGTYQESGATATLTVSGKSLKIDLGGKAAKANGKYTIDVDNGTLYLPLGAFNEQPGKTLKWD